MSHAAPPERPISGAPGSPPYRFVPGHAPHPFQPGGYAAGERPPAPTFEPLDRWCHSRPYLRGLDFFNNDLAAHLPAAQVDPAWRCAPSAAGLLQRPVSRVSGRRPSDAPP